MVVMRVSVAHFDTGNDVRFDAADQVQLEPLANTMREQIKTCLSERAYISGKASSDKGMNWILEAKKDGVPFSLVTHNYRQSRNGGMVGFASSRGDRALPPNFAIQFFILATRLCLQE